MENRERKCTAHILTGLPGSGKTTWARIHVEQSSVPTVIINRDSLRTMIHGKYRFDKGFEGYIKEAARDMAVQAGDYGFDVIIDETNLTNVKRWEWVAMLSQAFAPEISFVLVVCPEKKHNLEFRQIGDGLRGVSVAQWVEIIEKMKKVWEDPDPRQWPPESIIEYHIPEKKTVP